VGASPAGDVVVGAVLVEAAVVLVLVLVVVVPAGPLVEDPTEEVLGAVETFSSFR
jgi:hypothetical protein